MKKFLFMLTAAMFLVFSLATQGLCVSISNIQLSPASPSALSFNQHVDITFSYSTEETGGVRIFARPFTNGSLTPNYAAHGSIIHPVGSGCGTGFFTITAGGTTVDQIRFEVLNADQSQLLFEFFVPVHFLYQESSTSLTSIRLNTASPASLTFNQDVEVAFDYETDVAGGVRIFARPFTNGSLTPNYAAHGSIIHPVGSGSGTGCFTITTGDTTVDQIRFEVLNADQSQLLFEFFVPVEYRFPIAFVGLPEAPILSVSTSGRIVTISWTSIPNAEGYTLAYAPYPGLDYIGTLDMGTQTNAAFDFVAGNAAYYLAVLPYNANGNGTLSNIETFQIP
ncbi:MAG: hypothetical protein GQ555_02445 [Desulfobacterales bacterium]|nr:hypothetical protein [Desulfobacterales bacterium]